MVEPPRNAKVAVAKPLAFKLKVIKPSSAPVAEALVEIEWDGQNRHGDVDDIMKVQTNAQGMVAIPVLDPGQWLRETEITGVLRISKPHHGPVVAAGAQFSAAPAQVRVKFEPTPIPNIQVLNVAPSQQVRWGRPRVQDGKTLEVTLVEGGTLGKEFPDVPTRTLDKDQISLELMFHIARGQVALTAKTDLVIEHDLSAPDCVSGQCKILSLGAPSGHDPTFTESEIATLNYVDKLQVRNAVFGGLRVGTTHETDLPLIKKHKLGMTSEVMFSFGGISGTDLNPRNVVGIVRLARLLVLEWKARVLLSIGLLRNYEEKDKNNFDSAGDLAANLQAPEVGKLRRDAHGRGRAIDVSGVLLDHPVKLKSKDGTVDPSDPNLELISNAKVYVAQRDFLVFPHWGNLPMLFEKKGILVRGTAPAGEDYIGATRSTQAPKNEMSYRLNDINAPFDPTNPASIPKRAKGQELTPAHYEDARRLFLSIYQFFCSEYSQENSILGDKASAPQLYSPGEFEGRVLQPDCPGHVQRRDHQDHIHANLGHNGPSKAVGAGGTPLRVWASTKEMEDAAGYER